jgi:hypothetical protein
LNRKCHIVTSSNDGRRHLYMDKINMSVIVSYINRSDRHRKKWMAIVEMIMGGNINRQLYDNVEICKECKGVTSMNFFRGQENDRIYCKEQMTTEGLIIVVVMHVSKNEIPIIKKIGQYEYEIEKF